MSLRVGYGTGLSSGERDSGARSSGREDSRFVIGLVTIAFVVRLGYALIAEDLRAAPRADESVFTSIAPNLRP